MIKHLILLKVQNMMDINVDFNKKTSGGAIKKEIMQNEELAEELDKTIIRNFEKRKVQTIFGVLILKLFN